MAITATANSTSQQNNKTSASTLAVGYFGSIAAGVIMFCGIAKNNHSNIIDNDGSEVTSVADDNGNTYEKVAEFTNGQGSVDAGATISLWKCKLVNAVTGSHTVTATFSGATTAKVIGLTGFSVAANSDLQQVGTTQTEAADGADPGSLTIGSLSSKEYLFLRCVALETNSTSFSPTTNFTLAWTSTTSGGSAATNMSLKAEQRIVTTTSQASNPSMSAVDNASVYVAFEEVADVFSQAPGIGTETDTSEDIGIALGFAHAAETDTSLALTVTIVKPVGMASTTDTAPVLARGAELVLNGDGNAVTAWLDGQNATRTSVNGRIRVDPTTNQAYNAVAVQEVTTNVGPLHSMSVQLSAGNDGANPWAQFADIANSNYYLSVSTGSPPLDVSVVAPTTHATIRIALIAGVNIGQWTEFDNISAYQLGSPAVGVSVTPGLETDTAFALAVVADFAQEPGIATETDASLALSAVLIRAVSLSSETDTALSRALAHGTNRSDETDLALNRSLAMGIGFASEADTSLARSHILIRATGMAAETDLALALEQAAGGSTIPVGRADETDLALSLAIALGVNRANETDTAFLTATGHGTGRALETDAALSLGLALPVKQGNETDLAFRLGVGLAVNSAAETDLAVARVAIMLQATGFSLETDNAFAMLFGLEAREGFIKPVNLAWLDQRIQPVYVKANLEQVP